MNGSSINDEGASAMANYIAQTETLQILDFHASGISENGMEMIVNALKINTSIKLINLRSTNVTVCIGNSLLDLVENHNFTIMQMNIVDRTGCVQGVKPSVEVEQKIHEQIRL